MRHSLTLTLVAMLVGACAADITPSNRDPSTPEPLDHGEHVEIEICVLSATLHINAPRREVSGIAHARAAQEVEQRIGLNRDSECAKAGIVLPRAHKKELFE